MPSEQPLQESARGLWVPWDRVERLLDVGNQLADASRDQGLADEWDAARYKIVPQPPSSSLAPVHVQEEPSKCIGCCCPDCKGAA